MNNPRPRQLVLIFGLALSAANFFGKLNADPITLDNNPGHVDPGGQSSVSTGLQSTNSSIHPGSYAEVNSLPYVTPLTSVDAFLDSDTLTNALTTSGLDFGFSQVVGTAAASESGTGYILFQAGVGTTFSLTGSATPTGSTSEASLVVTLDDLTQGVDVYSYNKSSTTSLTLDSSGGYSSGGSLSGSLTGGDVYLFYAEEDFSSNGGSLTGSVDINFSQAPEPSVLNLVGIGAVGIGVLLRRRHLA